MSQVSDMTRGVYRRIYSGAKTGRRINRVTIGAEFCFWRIHMVADDFGRFPAEPKRLRAEAFPMRLDEDVHAVGGSVGVWTSDVGAWLRDLARAGLVATYEHDGELYGVIVDFEELQPANRSGRRIERYPAPPDGFNATNGLDRAGMDAGPDRFLTSQTDAPRFVGALGESGGVVGSRGESARPESDTESKSESKSESEDKEISNKSSSDPDSTTETEHQERLACLLFQGAVTPLIGREGKRQHPEKSAKYQGDLTSLLRWCDEINEYWDTVARFTSARSLAGDASRKDNPMAWLTEVLKNQGIIAA